MKPENWLLLLFCSFFVPELKAQDSLSLQFLRSFPVPEQVTVSADGNGNIFLSTTAGEIRKYDPNGQLLNSYSPQSASYFSTLDGRPGMQLRAFDENNQQLVYLDRFLNQSGSTVQLPPEHFGFISALSWSAAGNTVWIFDASDLQLKRWRTDLREIVSTLKLSQLLLKEPLDVKMLYEYQHKLYLFTTDKAFVFDQLGNYEKELSLPAWTSVTFTGDHLLSLSGRKSLELLHLYSGRKQKIPLIGDDKSLPYQKVLTGKDGELYLFTPKKADVYRFVP